jgi:hypothetical protein
MSDSSASTDRLFLLMSSSGSGTVDSVDDRDQWFSGFVKPVVKKRKGHVERVLRRMGR